MLMWVTCCGYSSFCWEPGNQGPLGNVNSCTSDQIWRRRSLPSLVILIRHHSRFYYELTRQNWLLTTSDRDGLEIYIYWDEAQAENILLMTNLDDLILLKWASRLVKTVNPQFSSPPALTLLCKQKINFVVESFENNHATVGTVVLRTMTEEDSAIKCIVTLSTFPMSC